MLGLFFFSNLQNHNSIKWADRFKPCTLHPKGFSRRILMNMSVWPRLSQQLTKTDMSPLHSLCPSSWAETRGCNDFCYRWLQLSEEITQSSAAAVDSSETWNEIELPASNRWRVCNARRVKQVMVCGTLKFITLVDVFNKMKELILTFTMWIIVEVQISISLNGKSAK